MRGVYDKRKTLYPVATQDRITGDVTKAMDSKLQER